MGDVNWQLELGRWQDVLHDPNEVLEVDAVITDPPYGSRTHERQAHRRKDSPKHTRDKGTLNLSSRGLGYAHWTAADVDELVDYWAPRCRGWFCAMTSHDLVPAYEHALERHGRYVFAPISCVQHAMNVRLAGDGPSNWAVHLVVARPRTQAFARWGTLPGAYVGPSCDAGENALDRSKRAVAGGKPLWLMRAIVRDYTRPGDVVVDPCAGGGTTLIASVLEGRRAFGAEVDPVTHAAATRLCSQARTPSLLDRKVEVEQVQHSLLGVP